MSETITIDEAEVGDRVVKRLLDTHGTLLPGRQNQVQTKRSNV